MILCKNWVSAVLRLSLLKARGCGPTFKKKTSSPTKILFSSPTGENILRKRENTMDGQYRERGQEKQMIASS
jgi:hypothetical protein